MSAAKPLYEIWSQVPVDYYDRGIIINPFQKLWHGLKFRSFKKLTHGFKCEKILDIGCASGIFTNRVSKLFPHSQIFAIDVYEKAIHYGRKKYPHIKFIVADAHNLPFKSSSFDLITCYETIEHVVDTHDLLRELKRVIKRDGKAIIAMDSGNFLFRLVWFVWEKTRGRVWQGAHLHPFHHSELEKIIKESDFRILKKHFSHFGMEISFILAR